MDKDAKPVEWLADEALEIYNERIKGLSEKELEDLDVQMLAVYCDSVANYNELNKRLLTLTSKEFKELQTWAWIVASYGDYLGFTLKGQERLRKKKLNFELGRTDL